MNRADHLSLYNLTFSFISSIDNYKERLKLEKEKEENTFLLVLLQRLF